jgi:hypothetical protein
MLPVVSPLPKPMQTSSSFSMMKPTTSCIIH